MAQLQACRLQLPFDPLPAELGRDLGAHLLTLCELDLEAKVHDGHRLAFQGAQPHLDPLVLRVVDGHVGEALGVEAGSHLPVEHRQEVAVERCGHAQHVVVGSLEPGGVLHEVATQQQGLSVVEVPGDLRQQLGALGRHEVADGGAEEGDHPLASVRQQAQVVLEVPDDGVDAGSGILGGDGGSGSAQGRLGDVEGHEALEGSGLGERVEEDPGLLRRPRAQLHEGVGPGGDRDVVGVVQEDLTLAPGEVVLVQGRDLVEQRAACLVVEPPRLQLLRAGRQAGEDVGSQGGRQVLGAEVDVDGERLHAIARCHRGIPPILSLPGMARSVASITEPSGTSRQPGRSS